MLNERERAVKEQLLGELPGSLIAMGDKSTLSYAEKKNLRDDLNPAFIDEKVEEMERKTKWLWIQPCALLMIMVAYGFLFDWSGLLLVAFVFAGGLAFAAHVKGIEDHKQRLFIYRALRTLAEPRTAATKQSTGEQSTVPPADAPGLTIAEMQRRKTAGSTVT